MLKTRNTEPRILNIVVISEMLLKDPNSPVFDEKWPSMRPTILKLLRQEAVSRAEWHDLFWLVHSVCLWDDKVNHSLSCITVLSTDIIVPRVLQKCTVHSEKTSWSLSSRLRSECCLTRRSRLC